MDCKLHERDALAAGNCRRGLSFVASLKTAPHLWTVSRFDPAKPDTFGKIMTLHASASGSCNGKNRTPVRKDSPIGASNFISNPSSPKDSQAIPTFVVPPKAIENPNAS